MRSDFVKLVLGLLTLSVLAVGSSPAQARPAGRQLAGTIELTAGSCSGEGASGSYFRMILPEGTSNGPFVSNGDSSCRDRTYTLLEPGSDGGLVLGSHQPEPDPPFDAQGNSRAGRITRPTPFFGVHFSTATNPTDPQTGTAVPAPSLQLSGDTVAGDLRSFGASWNDQTFNQGAPKPDGSTPGLTSGPTGTFDSASRAITIEWTSQIVGGPFDNFTGFWHLEGTLRTNAPASAAGAGSTDPAGVGSDAVPTVDESATTDPAEGDDVGPSNRPTITNDGTTATTGAADPTTTAVGADEPLDELGETAIGPTLSGGREAPAWLVILVAGLGLSGFAVFALSDRAIRRREADR